MPRIRRFFAALLLTLGACIAPAAAQDLRERLPGLWLIEAPYYDAFVDMGFDVPTFPVLSIRADGTYNLFRIRPLCEPVDGSDRADDYFDHPIKRTEACRAYIDATKPDGVAAHSNPSAAGKWELTAEGRLRLAIERRTEGSPHAQKLLDEMRMAMASGALDYRNRARTGESKATLARRLAVQSRRLATYHNTFYIFDGGPVAVAVEGDRLILTGADPDDRLVYRRIAPAAVAAAANIAHALELGASFYFRCTVENLRAGWTDRGPPAGDLGSLAALANEFFPLSWALEQADALDKAGRKAEAEQVYTAQNRAAFVVLISKIRAHPGATAAKEGEFGAWLGCPERDER